MTRIVARYVRPRLFVLSFILTCNTATQRNASDPGLCIMSLTAIAIISVVTGLLTTSGVLWILAA
jgi:hypothetical protein